MGDKHSKTVIIIDDYEALCKLHARILSNAGYRVHTCDAAKSGLEAIRAHEPDLILLDADLPGTSGIEFCRTLQKDENLRRIPVIFVGDHCSVDVIASGLEAGAVDFMIKPVDIRDFLVRVGARIRQHEPTGALAGQCRQLQSLEQKRKSLIQMTVHDLRTPLQACLSHLDQLLVRSDHLTAAKSQDHLQGAVNHLMLINRQLTAIIDTSLLERGELPVHKTPRDIPELIEQTVSTQLGPFECRRVEIRLPEQLPQVLCDPELTQRVLANFLSNALKFSPAHTKVVVTAVCTDNNEVRVEVIDRGIGIPKKDHSRIFDKFEVAHMPQYHHCPSSGIGLAFAKLAIDAQQCDIGLDSSQGEGSTFWFTIPRCESTVDDHGRTDNVKYMQT